MIPEEMSVQGQIRAGCCAGDGWRRCPLLHVWSVRGSGICDIFLSFHRGTALETKGFATEARRALRKNAGAIEDLFDSIHSIKSLLHALCVSVVNLLLAHFMGSGGDSIDRR